MEKDNPASIAKTNAEGIPRFFKSIRLAAPGEPSDIRYPEALPPKDSWIVLDPGTEFELDAKAEEEWLLQVQRFRRVRGNFLAACFDLEYTIDAIIGETFFSKPRSESSENLKRVFDKSFLKVRSFGKKLALLERLRKELPDLSTLITLELIAELKDLVEIRNGFAHFPIVFKPDDSDNFKTLSPQLALKYPPLKLDKSFFKKYGALIPKVSSALSKALQIINEDHSESGAAVGSAKEGKGNTAAIYIGHSIINTDIEDWILE